MAIENLMRLLRKAYYFKYYNKFQGKVKNVILEKDSF
jgi:hypothetical protein